MWKKYLVAASILLSFSASNIYANEVQTIGEARLIPTAYAESGKYFVICASTKSKKGAYRTARKMPGYRVIRTNRYSNLKNGLYAVVIGPYSYASAWDRQSGKCYIKSGW